MIAIIIIVAVVIFAGMCVGSGIRELHNYRARKKQAEMIEQEAEQRKKEKLEKQWEEGRRPNWR